MSSSYQRKRRLELENTKTEKWEQSDQLLLAVSPTQGCHVALFCSVKKLFATFLPSEYFERNEIQHLVLGFKLMAYWSLVIQQRLYISSSSSSRHSLSGKDWTEIREA